VLVVNFLAVLRADHLALQADVVLVVEHVELEVLLADGDEELDRDVDQSEGDRACPDGSGCHLTLTSAIA
jgi:hypothetical protein